MVAIAANNMNFTELTSYEVLDEIRHGRYIKYVYENYGYAPETVKKMLMNKEIQIEAKDIYYVDILKFKEIKTGTQMKLKGTKK